MDFRCDAAVVVVDVDESFAGIVIEKMTMRKADLREYSPSTAGKTRLIFRCPSRGLIGYVSVFVFILSSPLVLVAHFQYFSHRYRSEFTTDTRGTGVLNQVFLEYAETVGQLVCAGRCLMSSRTSPLLCSYYL